MRPHELALLMGGNTRTKSGSDLGRGLVDLFHSYYQSHINDVPVSPRCPVSPGGTKTIIVGPDEPSGVPNKFFAIYVKVSFYLNLLNNVTNVKNTLFQQCQFFAFNDNINIFNYIMNNSYMNSCGKSLNCDVFSNDNGLVDSIRHMFYDFNDNARDIIQLLVNPF